MVNTSKKKLILFISLSLISVIASCSSNNVPITATTSIKASSDFSNSNLGNVKLQQLIKSTATKGESVTVLDSGNGQKTNASFAFKINFGEGSFKTKASASGSINKVVSTDIKAFEIYLIESTTAPTGDISSLITVAISAGRNFSIGSLSLTNNATKTITFKNVKENSAASMRYYVAIAAKDSVPANITNLTAPANNGAPNKPFYVTNGGGGTPLGSVHVDTTTYALSDTVALTVTLKLADAIGATVESKVTVNDGAATDPIATTAS